MTAAGGDEAADRIAYLDREIAWFRKHLESVERDARRVPFLLVGIPAAIPVGLFWGGFIAFLTVVGTIVMTLAALYLTGVHKSQYRQKISDLARERETVERTGLRHG